MSSPFERQHSPANTKEEIGETQREVSGSTPFKKHCANTEGKGILTVITQGRSIRRAYFNNRRVPVSIDTCSLISMIESNNLRTNRIMKFGKKLKVNHLCKENDMGKGSSIGSVVKTWPRQSTRSSGSEGKNTGMKHRNAIPEEETLDDDMSNDLRIPAGRFRRYNKQRDENLKRKEEVNDPNITVDDKTSYEPCNSAF